MKLPAAGTLLLASLLAALPADAQAPDRDVWASFQGPPAALAPPGAVLPEPLLPRQSQPGERAAQDAALSLLLPGLGQHRQGRALKWVFASLEVVGWTLWAQRRADGASLRDAYRDFAWERGRLQASSRVDGDFDYYETLTKWERSGRFDADPLASGLQPEPDAGTFNGSIWVRARGLFLGGGGQEGDPGYEQAREYYRQNAYADDFLWDWSPDPGARVALADMITESDERYRAATTVLGALIANHVVSAVEAFVWGRGRDAPVAVRFEPGPWTPASGWAITIGVPFGP